MTLQQFLDNYHHDTTGSYDERYEKAKCFVLDACYDPNIKASSNDIYAFAERQFKVRLQYNTYR